MAEAQPTDSHAEFPGSWSCNVLGLETHPKPIDSGHVADDEDSTLSALCVPGSRLVRTGFVHSTFSDSIVLFVNAGGEAVTENINPGIRVEPDGFFQGGDVLRTNETIDGSDVPSVYQSARFGDFSYRFENLSPGDYFVDLHFAEIVYTNGPKGMRVFDVFMQEEKVLSGIDIYSIVGANKALQLVDVAVSVGEDGAILIRFDGVNGSPIVGGICIKREATLPASKMKLGHLVCNNCAAEIEISSAQDKYMRLEFTTKYEKKIEDLKRQFQLKTDECHEAWMSLTSANKQLQNITMELDNKLYESHCLDHAKDEAEAKLRDISTRYEYDKGLWSAVADNLESKVKLMKEDYSQLYSEVHKFTDVIPEFNNMVVAIQTMVAQSDELKLKFNEEQAKRKILYNQMQEAKGNIRVFCRCRPLRKDELLAGHATVVKFDAAKDGELGILTSGSTKKMFRFDRVYTPEDDQVDVFADASPMITSVLDGYNVCIFAYGQTGTGKTFTMEGSETNRGVNYRTLEQLFKTAEERKEIFTYSISVSVLEVYNEQIRDLLAASPTSKRLEMRQAPEGAHHIPGIVEAKVESIKEVWNVLQAGSSARAVGSNNVNEHSSRSHCILCIMVKAKNLITGESTMSKLWLVDLAGSERLAKTEVQGERLKEAQNINRSLSALGDVISALATKKSHIPYRNSKLTHLLQDSLGGDAKTLMFVQISPSEQDVSETISSLNFATRVRGVELGPARKQIDTGEVQKLKLTLDKLKQELKSKDDDLHKLEENFQNLEGKSKREFQLSRSRQEKINELEDQVAVKADVCRRLENQLLELSDEANGKRESCLNLQKKVKELEDKLKERERADSMILQNKVKDLENKLKERTQEYEHNSAVVQRKVQELEKRLITEENNKGALQLKVKELEEKLRQKEQEHVISTLCGDKSGAPTPNDRKSWPRRETIGDIDPLRLSNLSDSNQMKSQESVLLKGTDSLRELRRRRELHSKGHENVMLPATLADRKMSTAESSTDKSGDQKPLSRITRSLTRPAATGQKPGPSNPGNKNYRDQVPGSRSRTWLR
ncbi:kinesin-II 95 kDa subunit-like [Pyrus ussuriensis x Pyrus communis]|uniref:Kinesin-II 95 kDa subunit-like n=1 Tax=Pyrus ussuriensis x Pyrus communis TaxID=2448454 RepID=A0A5N5GN10_9ROSA|nr:kinesin-II 95 kDa subunit-like [Pyrus ussuriensis x Pyrus communis]